MRQDQRQLLATVARRGVGIAGIFLHHVRYMPEHRIALRMSVGVVDGLEVVDVEHDQADRVVVAAHLLDLGVEELLEPAVIRRARELVRDGLAAHLKMELDVLERQRRLGSQGPKHSRSSSVNGRPRRATVITPCGTSCGSSAPSVTAATLTAAVCASPTPPFFSAARSRFSDSVLETGRAIPHGRSRSSGSSSARPDAEPSAARLHGVDRRLQRELEQRRAIEARCERVANATDRLPQPHSFPGQLVEPAGQLGRHAVELDRRAPRTRRRPRP